MEAARRGARDATCTLGDRLHDGMAQTVAMDPVAAQREPAVMEARAAVYKGCSGIL